jgi:hypothetical protein
VNFSVHGLDRQSDLGCFAITSKPVIQGLEQLQMATVQVFQENVCRCKKEALNHKDVKVVSLIAFEILTLLVFDSVHDLLWSLSNATVT